MYNSSYLFCIYHSVYQRIFKIGKLDIIKAEGNQSEDLTGNIGKGCELQF
jgi:hypothetical protein